jgi:hypothetical protein
VSRPDERVAVVVVHWGDKADTLACLRSVAASALPALVFGRTHVRRSAYANRLLILSDVPSPAPSPPSSRGPRQASGGTIEADHLWVRRRGPLTSTGSRSDAFASASW